MSRDKQQAVNKAFDQLSQAAARRDGDGVTAAVDEITRVAGKAAAQQAMNTMIASSVRRAGRR